jgi:hypothetical protein
MTRYALVIGISQYEEPFEILSKAITDATAVKALLEQNNRFQSIELLTGEVTKTDLVRELITFLQQKSHRNEALIYFTGHGFTVVNSMGVSEGFLATSNCQVTIENDRIIAQQEGLSLQTLDEIIRNSNLSNLVVLLDSCHSGDFIERNIVDRSLEVFNSNTDYYLIAACRGFEKAFAKKREQHSVFTGALLKGLSQENADESGKITCDRLFDSIFRHLQGSNQEPIRLGRGRAIVLLEYPPQPKATAEGTATHISLDHLRFKFEQARGSWLSNRYSPDLHQTGQIEADLHLRLDDPSSQPLWLEEVRQIRVLLEDAHLAVLRLKRYPQFMQRGDAEDLIRSGEGWLIAAIAEQKEIEKRITPGNAFPLSDFETEVTDATNLLQLLRVLLPDDRETSESTTSDIGKQLEDALNHWYERKLTPKHLRTLGQPAAYIGEPGVGKTDALANAVRQHLEEGKPAILIRAKDIDLNQSWDCILADAISESGSNARQVLEALEAAATQAEVQAVAKTTDDSKLQPIRVLIALDGLDETSRAERWAEKLGELVPLVKRHPKVLFICSLRTNLFKRISLPNEMNPVYLSGSDAPLSEIFASYCKVNRIECPPLLRWALQTPLAVRLFADLYQGQIINTVTLQEFSLVSLINQKLNHAERAIRENDPEGWTETITPVRDALRAIVKACLSQGGLSQAEALQVAEEAQRTLGILSRQQLLNILDKCLDQGLLLLQRHSSDDPLEGDLLFWEPAYETLTDFLLASEACKDAKTNPATPDMPTYLRYRNNAIVLAAYLLGMEGCDFFATGLWSNDLSDEYREELRLTTILMMSPERGANYRDWVIEVFNRNMPSCRKVLDRLVVPGLRIPGYLYGAKFIHDLLLPMKVAERDLFWSGPNYVPHNHGAPWEGFGEPVLDELEIADDDPWDAAPLLLAWATTTVKNDSRRRIRAAITVWGSQKPDGLLALLRETCQTNDPQMKEDILSAAYGASCLTRPDEKWLPLCDWLIDNFFVPKAPLYTHNIVVRHSARSLIERCVACHVAIDAERLTIVRVPYVEPGEILCIDKDAAIRVNPHCGIEPATSDLAWYVVPRVIKPFFDEYRLAKRNKADSQPEEEEAADEFEDIDETLLNKFVEGSLRESADLEARQRVEEVLKARAEVQKMVETFRAATDEEKRDLLIEWEIQIVEDTQEDETSETQEAASEKTEYSPLAQAILSQHAEKYVLQDLNPIQLAFGFVSAYAAKLGWSKDVFIKQPKGGEPGEILGADIAILRKHPQARHGSRSTNATFGEKYVWAATNELSGFLADRVAVYHWDRCFEPPVELSLLAEPTNPASDVGYGQLQLNQVLEFSELIPDAELCEINQVNRANEWVQKAPLPDIQSLLFQNSEQLPQWAKNHEWVILRAFVIRRHADSQAESVLRASSFLFSPDALSLLEEDAQLGILPELYEFSSGIASVETYRDPCEVVWAPWIQEIEGLISHATLDAVGNSIKLNLQAATCQFSWEAPDGEKEEWVPAKVLRETLEIVDFREGKLLTANGQAQAFRFDISGKRWHTSSCQVLLARRDVIFEALTQRNLSLGWGISLNREPAYPLNVSSRKRMFRNWYAVALSANDALRVITYKDQIEPWYRDES